MISKFVYSLSEKINVISEIMYQSMAMPIFMFFVNKKGGIQRFYNFRALHMQFVWTKIDKGGLNSFLGSFCSFL